MNGLFLSVHGEQDLGTVQFIGSAPADAGARVDAALRAINPLYGHMREGDLLMAGPRITPVPKGTFSEALRYRPGQGKILRIYNDRKVRNELCERAKAVEGRG